MRYTPTLLASCTLCALPVLGQDSASSSSFNGSSISPFTQFNLTADNIAISVIPYGARLTSVIVPDKDGNDQDVLLGYDDPNHYVIDTETNHTYFGPVVGRYANRIKNGTFTIDDTTYHVPENEHGGIDTLHGGIVGYDQRNWTVTSYTDQSITFSLYDEGFEDFPGDVLTHATYTVGTNNGNPTLTLKLVSLALTKKTPIMLAFHNYWNLNAFNQPTVLNDTILTIPDGSRWVEGDNILIPTGDIGYVANSAHGALDYTKGKAVGADFDHALGFCGYNCTGVDTCFITGDAPTEAPIPQLSLSSTTTGITMKVSSNQPAVQIYTCSGQNGTIPVRDSQVQRNKANSYTNAQPVDVVNQYGCIVIETEQWIDGINHPEWGQTDYQIFGPESGPSVNWAVYEFSTEK